MIDRASQKLVLRVFDLLLGRPPSETEMANSVRTLDGAGGDLALLEAIAECSEYRERRGDHKSFGNQNLVELLFDGFLGRQPSEAEAQHFESLKQTGARTEDLVLRLYESDEFQRRRAAKLYVPPGHFYSPVVNTEEVRAHIPRDRPRTEVSLPDVQLDLASMERLWQKLVPILRNTPFSVQKSERHRYYFDNPAFSFADAMMLRAMILHHRPRRIVEVGSGFSSACTLDTVFDEGNLQCEITFVEPYPDLLRGLMRPEDEARVKIIPDRVQTVPLDLFKKLQSDDILFIDSTHIVKTGSDVAYELSTILPELAPGVIVHFHDVFYPFEYGFDWVVTENRSWNEIYALRAFLAFNARFEVIFFNDMFGQLRSEFIGEAAPAFLLNTGGSIWLRVSGHSPVETPVD
jgi:predicted O-methyltransferase YrrM